MYDLNVTRHLPVQECLMNGERRFFVECGDRNITPFETLEYLIRHYANTFAYTDRFVRDFEKYARTI